MYDNHTLTLKEKWDMADQLGYSVKTHMDMKKFALTQENFPYEELGLAPEIDPELISARDNYLLLLMSIHGNEIASQAKFTRIQNRKNEKDRYYRKNEYRLYIGDYATFIVEFGPTEDNLDIDDHNPLSCHQIIEDSAFRDAKGDGKALKETLKTYVQNTLEAS
jgi:hypothetical protein